MSTQHCAVCGDTFDTSEDTHYMIGEQERPVTDAEDREFDDWFSQSWFLCWECMYTKLGLVGEQ